MLFLGVLWAGTSPAAPEQVTGVVFRDSNRNGVRDTDEEGIAGVAVTNGQQVTRTERDGSYSLPTREPMTVSVVKPAGYRVPVDDQNVPQFHYIHMPEGTPEHVQQYPGIEPTGSLPDSLDFPLYRAENKKEFRILVLGDLQPTNHREVTYLREVVAEELNEAEGAFAIALGDIVGDTLSLYPRVQKVMGRMGLPVYYVPGNHDANMDAKGREHQHDTFMRTFGPTHYSFNVGKVHFVVLNSVEWNGENYRGKLGDRQLRWLRNDLSVVPEDHLIVLNMHIGLLGWYDGVKGPAGVSDRRKLYEIVKGRDVLALVGHSHVVELFETGDSVPGWRPRTPEDGSETLPFPQIHAGALCGGWWSGPADESGVPLSYQKDGSPKGYMVFTFNGTEYSARYRAAGRPKDRSMHVSLDYPNRDYARLAGVLSPERADKTSIVVNFFCGSQNSPVWFRVDDGPRVQMERSPRAVDPFGRRAADERVHPVRAMHVWKADLPDDLALGTHIIRVTARDMFGQPHHGTKLVEISSAQH